MAGRRGQPQQPVEIDYRTVATVRGYHAVPSCFPSDRSRRAWTLRRVDVASRVLRALCSSNRRPSNSTPEGRNQKVSTCSIASSSVPVERARDGRAEHVPADSRSARRRTRRRSARERERLGRRRGDRTRPWRPRRVRRSTSSAFERRGGARQRPGDHRLDRRARGVDTPRLEQRLESDRGGCDVETDTRPLAPSPRGGRRPRRRTGTAGRSMSS